MNPYTFGIFPPTKMSPMQRLTHKKKTIRRRMETRTPRIFESVTLGIHSTCGQCFVAIRLPNHLRPPLFMVPSPKSDTNAHPTDALYLNSKFVRRGSVAMRAVLTFMKKFVEPFLASSVVGERKPKRKKKKKRRR